MSSESMGNRLPSFFIKALEQNYSAEDCARIIAGLQRKRSCTFRINTVLAQQEDVLAQLAEAGFSPQRVDWYHDAFELASGSEGQLWKLGAYEAGQLYLQSLSSMLPAHAIEAKAGSDLLDMCAAPGGKTTQMAALYPQAHITACEINDIRADKLSYNLAKQGAKNVVLLRQDARKLSSFFSFDRILLDAPCSGSGTLYLEDPKLSKRFTEKLLMQSTKQQAALLSKGLELLKPGGRLVYSTCSVLKCENEAIVLAALQRASKQGSYSINANALDFAFNCPSIPKLPSSIEGALTVCPDEHFEGFFMVCISRKA